MTTSVVLFVSFMGGVYSYDASLANNMNFRCDLVYMDCKNDAGEDYWITDPQYYLTATIVLDIMVTVFLCVVKIIITPIIGLFPFFS